MNDGGKYMWVASRCVYVGKNNVSEFGLRYMASGGYFYYANLFNYKASEGTTAFSICPIVSIPSTNIDITTGDGAASDTAFAVM